ncbi:DUF6551 family protein [Novosphingobium sp. BL-52-GroH]|uniref:DUF6551 family protein n=1 Tax=Novosphingobium sp. BL-52-GroH TaxID=3349877 RepID=UPI00384B1D39
MAKQTTSHVKVNPPLGRMLVLQFLPPQELAVDATYQRSAAGGDSQALIRRIAQHWDWDLCLPLVVARRQGEGGEDAYFVIDGQHRLEAARLRGDIAQLPCAVRTYASVAAEAASFVKLNQERKPLKKLDLFKAAVASGDREACAIVAALADAGLALAPHGNPTAWKPGMVSNVAGIEVAWRRRGEPATRAALQALSQAFSGQVLQYAGTVFPGIAAVCADEIHRHGRFTEKRFEIFTNMLALRSQDKWREDVARAKAEEPNFQFSAASEEALRTAWSRAIGEPKGIKGVASTPPPPPAPAAPPAPAPAPARTPPPAPRPVSRPGTGPAVSMATGPRWCDQCDRKVDHREAAACRDKFCKSRSAAA